jgi:hypothetical protein
MGELKVFKSKNVCWRCEFNEGVYLFEDKKRKRTIGLCAGCANPELSASLSGDLAVAAKLHIPIGNGEYRRLSESTAADLDACDSFLWELSARQARDAEVSQCLQREATRLRIKPHQPVIPFLQQMGELGWLSDEGRSALDYALAHWKMNQVIPAGPNNA